jgi:GTPase SAR1 family protein
MKTSKLENFGIKLESPNPQKPINVEQNQEPEPMTPLDKQNVVGLFIGMTHTGKTAIIHGLENSNIVCKGTFFSDTKEPEKHLFHATINILKEQNDQGYKRKDFSLTIFDTPGFNDTRSGGENALKNEQIVRAMRTLVDNEERKLNFLAFIARAGDMQFEDQNIFNLYMKNTKLDFSNNSMLILTHCDQMDEDTLKTYIQVLRENDATKHILEYCKLGIYPFGIFDETSLKANILIPGITEEVRNKITDYKINRHKIWRQKLLEGMYNSKEVSIDVRKLLSFQEDLFDFAKRRCLI